MNYEKPPLSHEDLIIKLKNRKLIIEDESRVISYLKNIGYYRLSGYMFHLQLNDGTHFFKNGTSFDEITSYYKFDNKLRILLLSYLDRIEVGFRARLVDNFSINYGFFWYSDQSLYNNIIVYNNVLDEIQKMFTQPQERFLRAFKQKYTFEPNPPANMAMEVLSFGKLSKLYQGLKNDSTKIDIALTLNLPNPEILSSWLIHLTNVRNACAHHSRIWNRRFTADKPIIPSRKKHKFNGEIPENFNTSIYGVVAIMIRLLNVINPNNSFESKLFNLLDEYPILDLKAMGFTDDFKSNPAWKTPN